MKSCSAPAIELPYHLVLVIHAYLVPAFVCPSRFPAFNDHGGQFRVFAELQADEGIGRDRKGDEGQGEYDARTEYDIGKISRGMLILVFRLAPEQEHQEYQEKEHRGLQAHVEIPPELELEKYSQQGGSQYQARNQGNEQQ